MSERELSGLPSSERILPWKSNLSLLFLSAHVLFLFSPLLALVWFVSLIQFEGGKDKLLEYF